jgi:hypothetical protein
MTTMKYDKNFIFKGSPSIQHYAGDPWWIPLMRIDDNFMKGAFYYECVWIIEDIVNSFKPHSHDCDEYIGLFGSDIKDPFNLNAEVEFWLDDEKHIYNKNCIVYVPAGKWHTPIIIRNLKKPIFAMTFSPVGKYVQKVNRDPKWSHLPDPPEAES